MIGFVTVVAVAALLAAATRAWVGFVAVVSSVSMTPALPPGRLLLAWSTLRPGRLPTPTIRRGDIVVVDSPELNRRIVKRVIGRAGDHVVVDATGVRLNGHRLDEPYISGPGGPTGAYDVPQGAVFLLGDNRATRRTAEPGRTPTCRWLASGAWYAAPLAPDEAKPARPPSRPSERHSGATTYGPISWRDLPVRRERRVSAGVPAKAAAAGHP